MDRYKGRGILEERPKNGSLLGANLGGAEMRNALWQKEQSYFNRGFALDVRTRDPEERGGRVESLVGEAPKHLSRFRGTEIFFRFFFR